MIQELVREYYEKWQAQEQWVMPDLTDCLDFMMTEVAEAIDLRLRQSAYVRNNPAHGMYLPPALATEVFDAIMMGCIALDILGFDLMEVAKTKLEKMDAKRIG